MDVVPSRKARLLITSEDESVRDVFSELVPVFSNLAYASSVEVSLLLFMAVGALLMMLNRPIFRIALAGYRAQVEYMVWFFIILRLAETREDVFALFFSFFNSGSFLITHPLRIEISTFY